MAEVMRVQPFAKGQSTLQIVHNILATTANASLNNLFFTATYHFISKMFFLIS